MPIARYQCNWNLRYQIMLGHKIFKMQKDDELSLAHSISQNSMQPKTKNKSTLLEEIERKQRLLLYSLFTHLFISNHNMFWTRAKSYQRRLCTHFHTTAIGELGDWPKRWSRNQHYQIRASRDVNVCSNFNRLRFGCAHVQLDGRKLYKHTTRSRGRDYHTFM